MARFHFPAKPGKFAIRKPRISTRKFNFNSDKFLVAEKTEKFLADFYNLVGDSDEEEVGFNGFTEEAVEVAQQTFKLLEEEGNTLREELWLAKGVKLDRKDREIIKQNANKNSGSEWRRKTIEFSTEGSGSSGAGALSAPESELLQENKTGSSKMSTGSEGSLSFNLKVNQTPQENGWVEETPGMVGGRRSLTTPASHTNNLLVEGKRIRKPSSKLQTNQPTLKPTNPDTATLTPDLKVKDTKEIKGRATSSSSDAESLFKSVQEYTAAITGGKTHGSGKIKQIQQILQSQWKSRIKGIKNKERNVETGISKPEATHKPSSAQSEPSPTSAKPKLLLREPVLSVKPLHLFSQEWVDKLRGRKGRQELSRTIQQFLSKQNSGDKEERIGGKFSHLKILLCNGEFVNPVGCALVEDEDDNYGIVICGVCGSLTPAQTLSSSLIENTYLCTLCCKFSTRIFSSIQNKPVCNSGDFSCTLGDKAEKNCSACWLRLTCSVLGGENKSEKWVKLCKQFSTLNFVVNQNAGKKLNLDRDDPVFSILSGSETCSEISVKSTNKYSTPQPVINSSESNPPSMDKRLPRRTEMVLNLAGGWRKKVYKSRKRWSVLLLAPDSTVLRDEGELTKYLRLKKMKKTENVLNFHLPPLTEQVDEQIKEAKCAAKIQPSSSSSKDNETSSLVSSSSATSWSSTSSSSSAKRRSRPPPRFQEFQVSLLNMDSRPVDSKLEKHESESFKEFLLSKESPVKPETIISKSTSNKSKKTSQLLKIACKPQVDTNVTSIKANPKTKKAGVDDKEKTEELDEKITDDVTKCDKSKTGNKSKKVGSTPSMKIKAIDEQTNNDNEDIKPNELRVSKRTSKPPKNLEDFETRLTTNVKQEAADSVEIVDMKYTVQNLIEQPEILSDKKSIITPACSVMSDPQSRCSKREHKTPKKLDGFVLKPIQQEISETNSISSVKLSPLKTLSLMQIPGIEICASRPDQKSVSKKKRKLQKIQVKSPIFGEKSPESVGKSSDKENSDIPAIPSPVEQTADTQMLTLKSLDDSESNPSTNLLKRKRGRPTLQDFEGTIKILKADPSASPSTPANEGKDKKANSSSRWVSGQFICKVCSKDCGYRQNLYCHMKQHEKFGETLIKTKTLPRGGVIKYKPVPVTPTSSGAQSLIIARKKSVVIESDEIITDTQKAIKEDVLEVKKEETKTKWRDGIQPTQWKFDIYICDVCKKDCGYSTNLAIHRKRSHGILERQELLGPNSDVPRSVYVNRRQSAKSDELTIPKVLKSRFINRTGRRVKLVGCKKCINCRKPDCGTCRFCLDKKKFGGPAIVNKRCVDRRCETPRVQSIPTVPPPVSLPSPVSIPSPVSLLAPKDTNAGIKAMGCKVCEGCTRKECGHCKFCLDKRKFGGKSIHKKRCIYRVCVLRSRASGSTTLRHPSSPFSDLPDNLSDISASDESDDSRPASPVLGGESLEDFVEKGLTSSPLKNFNSSNMKDDYLASKNLKEIIVASSGISPENCEISVDYTEEFNPLINKVEGQGVILSSCLSVDLCYQCGSAGLEKMIICISCCEPVHPFCLAEDEMLRMDEDRWVCSRCIRCKVCGQLEPENCEETKLRKTCCSCGDMYHLSCIKEKEGRKEKDWMCGSCLKCSGCGVANVKTYSKGDVLCTECRAAKLRGSYCPICEQCYDDNDYELAMMECGKCGGWIHAKCEGLDGEKYQVLSLLPDTVEYVCRLCNNAAHPSWLEAVNNDILNKQNTIIENLLQHKYAKYFMISNSHKRCRKTPDPPGAIHLSNSRKLEEETSPAKKSFQGHKEANKLSCPTEDDILSSDDSIHWKTDESLPDSVVTLSAPSVSSDILQNILENIQPEYTSNCCVCLEKVDHSWLGPIHLNQSPDINLSKADHEPPVTFPSPTHKLPSNHVQNTVISDLTTSLDDDFDDDDEDDTVYDLVELEQKIKTGRIDSVLNLHLHLVNLLETFYIPGPKRKRIKNCIRSEYDKLVRSEFSWFNPEQPAENWLLWQPGENSSDRFYSVRNPYPEHSYSQGKEEKRVEVTLQDIKKITREKNSESEAVKSNPKSETVNDCDERKCLLCGRLGDIEEKSAGRLLYYRYNEWVHVNCALWSSEVYETVDGSLQNIPQVVSRARTLVCSWCGSRGAAVGCCHANCSSNYHFICGLEAQADYKTDKTIYCLKHAQKYASKENNADFRMLRRVFVDREAEEGRKKCKPVDFRNLKFVLGGVSIDSLGTIVEESGSNQALVPVGLTARKSFWSVLNPTQLTTYTCTTRLVGPASQQEDLEPLVIDHSRSSEETVKKLISEFQGRVEELNSRLQPTPEYDEGCIIPPGAVGYLWPGLDIEQLHYPCSHSSGVENKVSKPSSEEKTPLSSVSRRTGSVTPSPTHRKFNRAVIGFRTPKKMPDDLDMFDLDLETDDQLVSDILLSSDLSGNLDDFKHDSYSTGRREVFVLKTWFNANKRCKVREINTQTSASYDGVQLASDNVYTNLKPPSPDRMSIKRKYECIDEPCSRIDLTRESFQYLTSLQDQAILQGFGEPSRYLDENTDSQDLFRFFNKKLEDFRKPVSDSNSTLKIIESTNEKEVTYVSRILQFDGAADDSDEDMKPEIKQESLPIEIKAEEMKQEPGPSFHKSWIVQKPRAPIPTNLDRETASVESVSSAECASRPSTAGCSSTRGETPFNPTTTSTPITELEGDISAGIDTSVLCQDCGNTYVDKQYYEAHLSNCAKVEDFKEEMDDKKKLNLSLHSDGSPRKDFSIHGLLSTESGEQLVTKVEEKEEEIMIISENIIKKPDKVFRQPKSRDKRHGSRQAHHQQSPAVGSVQYMGGQHLHGVSGVPSIAQYGNALLQYGGYQYGLQPSIIQSSVLTPALVQPVQQLGGYIAVPSVQPLTQTIFYNNMQYNVGMQGQVLQQPGMISNPAFVSASQSMGSGLYQTLPITSSMYTNVQPSLYSSVQQNSLFSGVQPTSMYSNVQPTSVYSSVQPTTSIHSSTATSSHVYSNIQFKQESVPTPQPILQKPEPSTTYPPPPKKIARVQPTPHVVRPIPTKPTSAPHRFPPPSHTPISSFSDGLSGSRTTPTPPPAKHSILARPKLDPMKALTSLSKNPLNDKPTDLSKPKASGSVLDLSLSRPSSASRPGSAASRPNSVEIIPSQSVITASDNIVNVEDETDETDEYDYPSSPEPNLNIKYEGGINVTTKPSKTNSIKIVLQRENSEEDYNIREVMIKDGSQASSDAIGPKSALQALKIKARISRKMKSKTEAFTVPLDAYGHAYPSQETFINELEVGDDQQESGNQISKQKSVDLKSLNPDQPRILFDLSSADGGFNASGSDITVLWKKVYDAVSHTRSGLKTSQLPSSLGPTGEQMLGLTHSALRYLLEQFPGARRTSKYEWKHFEPEPTAEVKVNPTGCARSQPYIGRSATDMFKWLASRHRKKPHPNVGVIVPPEVANDPSMQVASGRRATSLDLPMAMRYRHLAKTAREAVGVYASNIHGIGLFCKREISAGEMVIEYAGEKIRAILTDYRERYYESKGIGCYMFRVDDDLVVDATVKGNAARFINHACEPNCYSKICDILGKKHIIIFSLRKILPGEELTYDYKFPIEDVKIKCYCGARKCKKFMN